MAAEPVKSQPLHNFSLAHLKWGHRSHHTSSNHRFRRRDSPTSTADLQAQFNSLVIHRRSPPSGSEGDSESESRLKATPPGSLSKFPFSTCSTQKQQPPPPTREAEEEAPLTKQQEEEENGAAAALPEEGEAKAWNLRPRKANGAPSARNGEMRETNSVVEKSNSVMPKSQRLRGIAEGGQGHRGMERTEKKRKFWISLSREEIEEDVYALTGSRPARRPKKRPKAVQKQVDSLFPGLYLVGLTVDSYRVHESLR